MPKKYELEKSIETKIRTALHEAGVICWKHNVDNRQLHTGLGVGVSDLICIVPPIGRFLAIEIKTYRPGSDTSEAQDRFLEQVRKFGGISGVARCVDDALALVAEARK
jgi:hypothetical protein